MSGESGRYDPDSVPGVLFRLLNALYTGKKSIEVKPRWSKLNEGFSIRITS